MIMTSSIGTADLNVIMDLGPGDDFWVSRDSVFVDDL